MNADVSKAKEILKKENYTCVLAKGDVIYSSHERGVAPLLTWLDDNCRFTGFAAADKVVGKAAAFLYVLLDVERVYAEVMSKPALTVLRENGIQAEYAVLADAIRNRSNTGFCPMETAVMEIDNKETALAAIRRKREEFLKSKGE